MYSKDEKLFILNKIENNRSLYEMIGDYESHEGIKCMFTDEEVFHEYNERYDFNDNNVNRGWAVNVKLSNGEMISCIASHGSYDEEDISGNDDFII